MGRPPEHDEGTARALLDAAEALLEAGGPDAVSVRAVARDAGTTTRAVYSLFDGKPGLVAALAARGYRLLGDAVDALPRTDDPAADLIAVGLDGFRPFAIGRPSLFRLTLERVTVDMTSNPVVHDAAGTAYQALARWIERAIAAGVIVDQPVERIAFLYHGLCQGLAGGELSRMPPPVGARFWGLTSDEDVEASWRIALTALVAGLAPDAAHPT